MSPTFLEQDRTIRLWLYVVAALVFLMVIVGGATRLTESGLSITEWKPVTGTLPPLSADDWQGEFAKYKAIPQYAQVNRGMGLDEFKTIYWWEWGHRLLGRVIGAAFLLPFLYFLWRGSVRPGLRGPLWAIFGLGAFQGAVGWWMVTSGLVNRVSVSPYRLAFHLTVACVIYAAILWTARRLSPRAANEGAPGKLSWVANALVVLVLLQIYIGALVAGLDAGLAYNTWPSIDGSFIPSSQRLFFIAPLWRNFFENILTVQFEHRMVAYLLWGVTLAHALATLRPTAKRARLGAWLLFAGVSAQAALGIHTLLAQAPLNLSLTHQAMAVVVLTLACVHAEYLRPRARAAEAPETAALPA